MENLDLKKLNLREIDSNELKEINGGLIVEVLIGIAVGWLLGRLLKKAVNSG